MPYTPDTFTNFAVSQISGGAGGAGTLLDIADTSLLLPTGDGAKLPATGPFMLLLGTLGSGHELVKCTARSSDTLTIVRGQEGTTAQAWPVGTTVQQAATAGNLSNLWTASPMVYNVMGYGAAGDGTTDDTSAIQAAINAAQASSTGHGLVYLPAGTYKVSSTLLVSNQNMHIAGAGWATHVIAASGMTGALLKYSLNGTLAGYMGDCALHDIWLDGNSQTGVHGVQLDATYHFSLFHCRIGYCGGYAVYGNGNGSFTGAYTNISHCHIEHGTLATSIGLYTNFHEWGSISNTLFDWFNTAGAFAIQLNNGNWRLANVGFDECDTAIYGNFVNYCSIVGCQFERGLTRHMRLRGCRHVTIDGCHFGSFAGTGSKNQIDLDDGGNRRNVISGCTCVATDQNGNYPGWATFVSENANLGKPGNLYIGNETDGLPLALTSGTARANHGYNPVQTVASPVAPTVSNAGTGGTIAAGTYQVAVTMVTAAGETAGSAAASTITTGTTSTITISSPVGAGNAYGWYAYVTQAGGAANTATRQQTAGAPTPLGNSLTISAPPTNTGAVVPTSNTTTGVTTPAVPATTVAVQNTTGVDVNVQLTGGTVTAITIGNTATGRTSGSFRLPARQTITLTYSVAPTWVWFGE